MSQDKKKKLSKISSKLEELLNEFHLDNSIEEMQRYSILRFEIVFNFFHKVFSVFTLMN